jgi:polysaccharide biosynthesis protein PslG
MLPRVSERPWLVCVSIFCFSSLLIFSASCNVGKTSSASSPAVFTPPSTAQTAVSITPESISVPAGKTTQFSAAVRGASNSDVRWGLAGLSSGSTVGSITASGLYMATLEITSGAEGAVKATSVADQNESGSALVTVTPTSDPPSGDAGVTVSPSSVALSSGGTQQFWDKVNGTGKTAVIWKAEFGTITTAGLYIAPHTTTQVVDTVTATSVTDSSKTGSSTITVSAQGSVASGIPSSFFGMHINELNVPWPTVPFASYRSLDSGPIMWADLNPQEGKYDWSTLDRWIAKARAGGQDIMYTLFATPSWASSGGSKSVNPNRACALAKNGPGVCDAPDDLNPDGTGTDQHWKDFVTAMINHVGPGTVKYWEIWNEWNIANQWSGTPAQMLRLAQDAHRILKAADPNALITSPPVVNTQLAAKNWLLPYFQAGGSEYADVIAVHGYVSNPRTVCPRNCPIPENVAAILDSVREVMLETGQQDKPLFDTEGSWGVSSRMTDREQQAEFTARFYLIQLGGTVRSAGFDKFYWFGWDYTNTGGFYDPYTRQITPAGVAYQQIYNWSKDAVMSRCAPSGTRWSCGFTRSGGYQAEAVWDTSQGCANAICPAVSVSVDPKYVQYRDLAGQVKPVTNSTVPVGGRPILLENGNPN